MENGVRARGDIFNSFHFKNTARENAAQCYPQIQRTLIQISIHLQREHVKEECMPSMLKSKMAAS